MVTFEELLARTAGLRWNEPLERLAGARLQRLADAYGSLAELRRAAGDRADVAAEVAAAFTVGETWFHRFGEQLDAAALALRSLGRPVRVWSAGCSTGEEVYALLGACLRADVDARALGTDLNPKALAVAAGGVYPRRALRDTPPDRVMRVFTLDGPQVRVKPEVRARARFGVHNLMMPAPEAAFDVICCRNVLIYFTPAAAQQVCEHLITALAPGGLLLLAPSDPRPPVTGTLEQVRVGGTVLLRRAAARAPAPHVPVPRASPSSPPPAAPPAPAAGPDLAQARQWAFLSPHDPQAQLNLARAFLQAGQPTRAAASLRGAQAQLAARSECWETAYLRAQAAQVQRAVRDAERER